MSDWFGASWQAIGYVALGTLAFTSQVALAAVRQRWALARRILDFPPQAVVKNGQLTLPRGPLSSQLSRDELASLLRQKGFFDLDGVHVVLLEPSGGISVSTKAAAAESASPSPAVDV